MLQLCYNVIVGLAFTKTLRYYALTLNEQNNRTAFGLNALSKTVSGSHK